MSVAAPTVGVMEEFTRRGRRIAHLAREFALQLKDTAGWSATPEECVELTDVLVAVKAAAEAAYLRAFGLRRALLWSLGANAASAVVGTIVVWIIARG